MLQEQPIRDDQDNPGVDKEGQKEEGREVQLDHSDVKGIKEPDGAQSPTERTVKIPADVPKSERVR